MKRSPVKTSRKKRAVKEVVVAKSDDENSDEEDEFENAFNPIETSVVEKSGKGRRLSLKVAKPTRR